jgi:hypothetical protein
MALIAGRVSTWDIVTVVVVDDGEVAPVVSMVSIVVAERMLASRRIAVVDSMCSSIFGWFCFTQITEPQPPRSGTSRAESVGKDWVCSVVVGSSLPSSEDKLKGRVVGVGKRNGEGEGWYRFESC